MDINLKVKNSYFLDRFKNIVKPLIKDDIWKYTDLLSLKNIPKIIGLSEVNIDNNSSDKFLFNDYKDHLNINYNYFDLLSFSYGNTYYIDIAKSKDRLVIDRKFINGFSCNNIVINIAENISVDILENISGDDSHSIFNTTIFLSRGSKVNYIKNSNFLNSKVLDSKHFHLSENSFVDFYDLSFGTNILRNNVFVDLMKDSLFKANGVYLENDLHIDNYLSINHRYASESYQNYKGIVKNGKASFVGAVKIDEDAFGSSAHQINRNILLGEGSVNSRPILEILTDDVKCTHGSTIGRIDDEQLFYITSRGLSLDIATNLMNKAFLEEVFVNLKVEYKDKLLSMLRI
jgi:Fe-S cluster assembly protein SufD